jgi:hypothetical protein
LSRFFAALAAVFGPSGLPGIPPVNSREGGWLLCR